MIQKPEEFGNNISIRSAMEGPVTLHEIPELGRLRDRYKKAGQLIRDTRTLYRAVMDSCTDGLVVIGGGTCLHCNQRYLEMLGYESMEDLPKEWPLPVDESDVTGLSAYIEDRRKGVAGPSVRARVLRRTDGSAIPVLFSASPVTYGGKPAVLCFVRDIAEQEKMGDELVRARERIEELVKERTRALEEENARLRAEIAEHVRVEDSLRQSEKKYRSILDNAVEGIFRIDPRGAILSVNCAMARMHGYRDPGEMIALVTNLPAQFYVESGVKEDLARLLRKEGTVKGFEARFRRKDGTVIWGSLNIRAEKDNKGEVLFYEGTIEDITSRKATEEELCQTLTRLSNSLKGAINAMSLTVETRDPYTSGHQKKVSNLASLIAREMRLPSSVVDNIRMAGIVHDIGKMSVPAEILSKPRNLSDMEMNLLKVHPRSGYEILKEAELPYPIATAVLQHHERLDGSGYPEGLSGSDILLEAKIIAVADVVEALASHRPYRPAHGIEAALMEIEKNKDILYDAEAVEACLRLFREKGFTLEPGTH